VSGGAEVAAVLALLGLLVVAFRHPSGRVELLAGLVGAGVVLAVGGTSLDRIGTVVHELGPVVVFLAVILVVAENASALGVFRWVAHLLVDKTARAAHPGRALLTGAFVASAAVTVALSLDATVVLLVPVLLTVAATVGLVAVPAARAAVRVANSGSLLLPVANLTNLLAMPALGLTFGGFALRMAPAWAAVMLVEYAALRWWFRRDLADRPVSAPTEAAPARSDFALVTIGLMLVGFAVTAPWEVAPAWVAGAAAVALSIRALTQGALAPRAVLTAAHLPFAFFVLCLGVVVDVLGRGGLADVVRDLLPTGDSLGAMLLVTLLATVLANVLNNLPATLLLVPLLAPAGPALVLAALVGLNVGSGLTYAGSLANLLWRRVMVRHGAPPDTGEWHRYSLVVTPVALAVATPVLWATLRLAT